MSRPGCRAVLAEVHRLAGSPALDDCTDRVLLERFCGRRDQAAGLDFPFRRAGASL